jgi:hypothetical protein
MRKEEIIRAIAEVRQHPGWEHMRRIMQEEIQQATQALCSKSAMPNDELHFRRGALWAALKMVALPENIELRLRNDILIEKSMPATAGETLSATADTKE